MAFTRYKHSPSLSKETLLWIQFCSTTCRGGGRSKFRDVVAAIRSAIAQGSLAPGDQLPPVRDLAWKLDMTPGTVARAYAALTDEGITEGQVGRGTFIAPPSTPVQFVPEPWFDAGLAIEAEADDQVSLFATALPDMGQVALIHSAFARLGSRSPRDLLAYPSRSTFEPARRAVLHWLSGAALGPIDHEDLVLSHGGQSGVSLVMQSVLHGRKPVVLLEELTYPGFRRAAQLLRADVVSVPMDAQGIIPEALAELAQKHDAQLLCTCPEVHNPTGIFTPEERRIQIAEVAAQHGLHILEDDCYPRGRCTGVQLPCAFARAWVVCVIAVKIADTGPANRLYRGPARACQHLAPCCRARILRAGTPLGRPDRGFAAAPRNSRGRREGARLLAKLYTRGGERAGRV